MPTVQIYVDGKHYAKLVMRGGEDVEKTAQTIIYKVLDRKGHGELHAES